MIRIRSCLAVFFAAAAGLAVSPAAATAAATPVFAELDAVSCASATECFAVGSFVPGGRGQDFRPLIERFNGTRWSVATAAVPTARWSRLFGISCAGPADCFAVGEQNIHFSFDPVTLAEHWNGGRWSIVPTPVPAKSADSELLGVSCPSPASCMAAGDQNFNTDRGPATGLTERWDGTRWKVVPAAAPPGTSSLLAGVSCRAATDCTAVGWSAPTVGSGQFTLISHWDGTRWRVASSPNPPKAVQSTLFGVACPAATACIATGEFFTEQNITNGSGSRNLGEQWDGTNWSLSAVRNPPGSGDDQLSGISCTAAQQCMAVGSTAMAGGPLLTLAQQWNGQRWSVLATPNPPFASSGFGGVSCPLAARCVAVGTSITSSGDIVTLTEVWRNGVWRIIASPSP